MTSSIKTRLLFELSFLGFRYSGWQKQINTKHTIYEKIERTLRFILGSSEKIKIFGGGRTDAFVSADSYFCEVYLSSEITDTESFQQIVNKNLPMDIQVLHISILPPKMNVLHSIESKEYRYLFCKERPHPYCAPFIGYIPHREILDIALMGEGAQLFLGTWNYKNYAYKPEEKKSDFSRTILSSSVSRNSEITASFFPKETFEFVVSGKGFLRHQVRLMMGALFRLGWGEISLADVSRSLSDSRFKWDMVFLAPPSGLRLSQVQFSKDILE